MLELRNVTAEFRVVTITSPILENEIIVTKFQDNIMSLTLT